MILSVVLRREAIARADTLARGALRIKSLTFGDGGRSVRRLSFDQYEFDSPSSEEALELVVSSSQQIWPLPAFLMICGASMRNGSPPPAGWPRWAEVVATVSKRAGIELPAAEACEVVVLSDDWDDLELAVVAGHVLVWYHWWTTA